MPNNPIVFREYELPDDFPFLYMNGTTTSSKTAHIHFHDCIELAVLEKGYMIWKIENKETRINARSICIIPPYFTHTSWSPPDQPEDILCHYLYFRLEDLIGSNLSVGLFQDMLLDCYFAFPHILDEASHSQVLFLLDRIILECHKKSPSCKQEISAIIELLFIKYWRKFCHLSIFHSDKASLNSMSSLIAPALLHINRNFYQEFSILSLAQLCNMPEPQFRKVFQNITGKSVLQYIRQIKIQHACILLIRTETSILDIAYTVGFSSLASFNRSFSEVMNLSPSAFRNKHRSIKKKQIQLLPYPKGNLTDL